MILTLERARTKMLAVDTTNAYPEWIQGAEARARGEPESANPYPVFDDMGMYKLWESGWEAEKDASGSRFWCDHCRKPLYDSSTCGNCGKYGTT